MSEIYIRSIPSPQVMKIIFKKIKMSSYILLTNVTKMLLHAVKINDTKPEEWILNPWTISQCLILHTLDRDKGVFSQEKNKL